MTEKNYILRVEEGQTFVLKDKRDGDFEVLKGRIIKISPQTDLVTLVLDSGYIIEVGPKDD